MVRRPRDWHEDSADIMRLPPRRFARASSRTLKLLVAAGAATVVIAGLLLGWSLIAGATSGDVRVYLRGSGVSELEPGSKVVLESVLVGEVVGKDIRDGTVVAELRIDGRYARQIAAASQFEVDSLNRWMPGNLGVRIYNPPKGPTGQPPIADGAQVTTLDRALPPEIPERFYLLVLGCVGALVVLVLVARLMRSLATLVVGIAILAIIVMYLGRTIAPPTRIPPPLGPGASVRQKAGTNVPERRTGRPVVASGRSPRPAGWPSFVGGSPLT